MRNFLLGISMLLSFQSAWCQFEGVVHYQITYETDDPSIAEFTKYLPTESTLSIKGTESRFEQLIAGGGRQVYINKPDEKTGIFIMNFMGQEFQVNLHSDSIMQLQQIQPFEMVYCNERKNILGYSCKKAWTVENGDTLAVYYNDAIYSGMLLPQFRGLKGIPMEYEISQNQLHLTFVAKKVERIDVDKGTFSTSNTIRSISFTEFSKNFAIRTLPLGAPK